MPLIPVYSQFRGYCRLRFCNAIESVDIFKFNSIILIILAGMLAWLVECWARTQIVCLLIQHTSKPSETWVQISLLPPTCRGDLNWHLCQFPHVENWVLEPAMCSRQRWDLCKSPGKVRSGTYIQREILTRGIPKLTS